MSDAGNKVIYSMIGVSKFHNKKPIIKDISLSYFYGAKIGVLGLNGSGKSTLLRIMAGVDTAYNGETILSEGYTVGFLEQEPLVNVDKTVREAVEEGVQETVDLLNEFNRINEQFAEPMGDDEMDRLIQRQGEVQDKLDALDAWDLDARLEMAMDALRCPPGDTPVSVLSGGERRRVALCRLLLQKPDILLLDEPTNHLDAESVAWLEHHLQEYPGTVIAVTHDRYFLDNVAGWILELDRGYGIPWKGNYSSWLEQKHKRLAQEEKQESQRRKTLEREIEWIRMSPKGRRAKSKARITSYESMLKQETEKRNEELEIYIPPGPRLGNEVISASSVAKAYGDRILIEEMTFAIPPGAIVGVIGPNGAGKTTLFRMITGQETPDSGAIRVGRRSPWPTWTRAGTCSPPKRISGRRSPRGRTASFWAAGRSTPGPMWRASTFPGPTSRKRSGCFRGASGTGFTWPGFSNRAPTCCSWTSRPTTWTSTPCAPWKRPWRTLPAAPWSSAMTDGSWTGSRPTSSPSRGTAGSSGSRAITPTTKRTERPAWAPMPTCPNASSTGV